jgi:hypothetical protein
MPGQEQGDQRPVRPSELPPLNAVVASLFYTVTSISTLAGW